MFFGHVGDGGGGGGGGRGVEDATRDLNHLFDGRNFDTVNAGPKTERGSYERIADELGAPPAHVLFLSDNVNEIRAAEAAGMEAVVVDRPGNAPLSEGDRAELRVVRSLDEIEMH
jgi:enolase-phosphatase E1